MTLDGTIVNGLVVFDGPTRFPEGSRVHVLLADADDELDTELAGMPAPPTETYEEHLALLRESIAAAKAGERGYTVAESMARLDAELDRLAVEERNDP